MRKLAIYLLIALIMTAKCFASELTLVRSDGSVIKTTDTPRPTPQFDRVVEVKDPTAYYKCMDEATNHHIRSRRYELMEKCNNIVMGEPA